MRGHLRRWGAWLGVLCLVLSLAPASRGSGTVYFTAVNDQVLDLTADTMPFWSGGQLYISETVFDEAYRRDLNIICSASRDRKTFLLWSGRISLTFDLNTNACYDNRGNLYETQAVDRGTYVFFPLDTVCSFFGLAYSYMTAPLGPLVRIKSAAAQLDDTMFMDAAGSLMRTRYNTYLKELENSQTSTPPVTVPPVTTPPDPPDPPANIGEKTVSLALTVTEENSARQALSAFSRYQMQGTFLMTADQLETMPDLVRSLVAGGQTIALDLREAGDIAGELERGREALWQAACASTRLAWPDRERGGEALEAAGFRRLTFDLDYSGRGVSSSGRAETILNRLSSRRETVLYLGPDTLCGGLGTLLRGFRDGDYKVLSCR